MPGAFTHISAVHYAVAEHSFTSLAMSPKARDALINNIKFIELGCLSPDYPTLKLDDTRQRVWADRMHREQVGSLIKKAITLVAKLESQAQEKAFSWLCGFVAHVITDITIHPVVELRVGPFHGNERAHRICEMHQDSYLRGILNLTPLEDATRIKHGVAACNDAQNKQLDSVIETLWRGCLVATYPQYVQRQAPAIKSWHQCFLAMADNVQQNYPIRPEEGLFAVQQGLLYPRIDNVELSYIENLLTPCGNVHFDVVFAHTVKNIQRYWCDLARAIFDQGSVDMFLNWNLDTGRCETNRLTMWCR